ncbi:hypothetical protein [Longimicrobium sp.]|jgi:hypothetical protein|uniref:hypothetical protein n=1 Tax=Longimicrobium sp. TaxID=2029185 RepID=UPI002ED9859C
MSDLTPAAPATGALQFDTAEPSAATTERSCTGCKRPIEGEYHMANMQVVCTPCRHALEAGPQGSRTGRIGRAILFGAGAAVAGSLLYFVVLAATGYEIGLIAILVGWMVGRAVSIGSHGRGGWVYQVVAIGFTYLAICTSFIPAILEAWRASGDAAGVPGALIYIGAFIFSLTLPVLTITSAPIGVLILGFGLYQAWRETKRPELTVTGPYAVAPTPQPQLAG